MNDWRVDERNERRKKQRKKRLERSKRRKRNPRGKLNKKRGREKNRRKLQTGRYRYDDFFYRYELLKITTVFVIVFSVLVCYHGR